MGRRSRAGRGQNTENAAKQRLRRATVKERAGGGQAPSRRAVLLYRLYVRRAGSALAMTGLAAAVLTLGVIGFTRADVQRGH